MVGLNRCGIYHVNSRELSLLSAAGIGWEWEEYESGQIWVNYPDIDHALIVMGRRDG